MLVGATRCRFNSCYPHQHSACAPDSRGHSFYSFTLYGIVSLLSLTALSSILYSLHKIKSAVAKVMRERIRRLIRFAGYSFFISFFNPISIIELLFISVLMSLDGFCSLSDTFYRSGNTALKNTNIFSRSIGIGSAECTNIGFMPIFIKPEVSKS